MNETPSLTDTDRDTISRARALLAEDPPSRYELGDMAARIGALEWHLDAALRLAERLAAAQTTAQRESRGIVTPHGIAELLPADWPSRHRDTPPADG